MGLAIMRFYLIVPIPVYGTLWILLIAFVTRYIPYGIRYTHSGATVAPGIGGSGLCFRGFVVECDAANYDAFADPVFFGRVGFYFPALRQGTVDVDPACQSTNAGGFRRYL